MSIYKKKCIACGGRSVKINKEHIFPMWLIKKTNTHNTSIKWFGKNVPATSATVPICRDCNKEFGIKLEVPVKKIFYDLEGGRGVSDNELEILVRWMWKIAGLQWKMNFPTYNYTKIYSLKERVLNAIDYSIRGNILVAVGLIRDIDTTYGDMPLGIDSINVDDAIFVSGVFSKIAIIVSLDVFYGYIPDNFTIFKLMDKPNLSSDAKLMFPKCGFNDDTEAVGVTKLISDCLSVEHDKLSVELQSKFT